MNINLITRFDSTIFQMLYSRSNTPLEEHGYQRSNLEDSVISALRAALMQRSCDLEVTDEYSAFDGAFPVDATVYVDGVLFMSFVTYY